jgi:peptidyl-prolyl cis-trans isomerase SurA
MWDASADALIVTTTDEKLVNELKSKITSNTANWRSIVESYGNSVVADSSRYELSQIPVVDRTNFQPALATAAVKNTDGSTTFAYIFKVYRNPEQRNFEDARGLVINDYQGVLEERWLKELKKKYPVKVNEVVLASIK